MAIVRAFTFVLLLAGLPAPALGADLTLAEAFRSLEVGAVFSLPAAAADAELLWTVPSADDETRRYGRILGSRFESEEQLTVFRAEFLLVTIQGGRVTRAAYSLCDRVVVNGDDGTYFETDQSGTPSGKLCAESEKLSQ